MGGKDSKIANAILAGLSTLMTLVAIEIFLNYFHNYNGVQIYRQGDKVIDTRDKTRVLYELYSDGIEAYPGISPAIYMAQAVDKNDEHAMIPLSGISRSETAFCNELNKFIVYRSDRFGFNNDDHVWDVKSPWLLVGDSFAQGVCVPQNATIAANLTRLGATTISIGMSRSGPLLEYASLVEYGTIIKPSVVIWQYYEGNDLEDFADEVKYAALRNYFDPMFRQGLMGRQSDIDRTLKNFVDEQPEFQQIKEAARTSGALHSITRFRNSRTLIRNAFHQIWISHPSDVFAPADTVTREHQENRLAEMSSLITRAKALVEGWGGKMYLVYMPEWKRFDPKHRGALNDNVLNALMAHEISVVNLTLAFDALSDPRQVYNYPDRGGHLNEEGYALASRYILNRIAADPPKITKGSP
jgi:hypothetical protein